MIDQPHCLETFWYSTSWQERVVEEAHSLIAKQQKEKKSPTEVFFGFVVFSVLEIELYTC
jgi:hypothetical protein